MTKSEFSIDVYWPVSDSDEWIPTSSNVIKETGITRYALYKTHGDESFHQYTLRFTNIETYDYFFTDEISDFYQSDAYSNGDHYVQYDSEKPNIVAVRVMLK